MRGEDMPTRGRGVGMAGEGGVTEVLGCWLLHGVAGAYGAVVRWGGRVAGLRLDCGLGWGVP